MIETSFDRFTERLNASLLPPPAFSRSYTQPERRPEKAFVAEGQVFHWLLQDRFTVWRRQGYRAGGTGLPLSRSQAGV